VTRKVNNFPHGVCIAETTVVKMKGGKAMMVYILTQSIAYFTLKTPRFAPFVAAGYLVAHSDMLREVPFDPFLPYIFIGEEILLSARLWTSGYDIFSPTQNLLGHLYVRNNTPKFWDSLHRVFTAGVSILLFH